jgi:Fe2+ transport system protein FeoA
MTQAIEKSKLVTLNPQRLTEAEIGKEYVISGFLNPSSEELQHDASENCVIDHCPYNQRYFISRLADMGITPGIKVKILMKNNTGPILLQVRDMKLAIGHGMANKISVQ